VAQLDSTRKKPTFSTEVFLRMPQTHTYWGEDIPPAGKDASGEPVMNQYCYVIVNNAGHSWAVINPPAATEPPKDENSSVLPQLLKDGWVPIRETPMGGGASPLAHSLILLERGAREARKATRASARSRK
jgi:hypothetical protein